MKSSLASRIPRRSTRLPLLPRGSRARSRDGLMLGMERKTRITLRHLRTTTVDEPDDKCAWRDENMMGVQREVNVTRGEL